MQQPMSKSKSASRVGLRSPFILAIALAVFGNSCGGTGLEEQRDLSVLVQVICESSTVREFRLLWDGEQVDDDKYTAITVDLTSLGFSAPVATGRHTIGVLIASQTASPNRCTIYGILTAETGGPGNGSQIITIPTTTRSLATGTVSNFAVTVN